MYNLGKIVSIGESKRFAGAISYVELLYVSQETFLMLRLAVYTRLDKKKGTS